MQTITLTTCVVIFAQLSALAVMAMPAANSSLADASCFFESGFDYVGNDIANVASNSADGCCSLCSARSGCRALTWTDHDGGTCWLKSGRGTVVTKDGAKSSTVMSDSTTCSLEEGIDFVGNDIFSAGSSTAEGCCQLCEVNLGCRAFTWTNHDSGTCYLKTTRETTTTNAGARSGTVSSTSTRCLLDEGIDYVGNDIGSASALKPLECCSACQFFPGCRAFTFTTHNGGTCWFKSKKGRMAVSSQAQSAEPYAEGPTCGLEYDFDYVGNDIGSTSASSPGECCSKCEKWNGCRAFSWNNVNGGTCWLKNLKGEAVKKTGVTSAQVLANPPAPSCALELGVDYIGNDFGSSSSSDAYGCCSICMAHSGCKAFSWTNQNGGTCWLKSAKGVTKADAKVKSAVV